MVRSLMITCYGKKKMETSGRMYHRVRVTGRMILDGEVTEYTTRTYFQSVICMLHASLALWYVLLVCQTQCIVSKDKQTIVYIFSASVPQHYQCSDFPGSFSVVKTTDLVDVGHYCICTNLRPSRLQNITDFRFMEAFWKRKPSHYFGLFMTEKIFMLLTTNANEKQRWMTCEVNF